MDILHKRLSKFNLPQQVREQGLYPYFREIEGKQGTEVEMDGHHVIMLGSNAYTGLTGDERVIEAGVAAMADDVWAWCEKTGSRGRTVTVKVKWADFQQSTRSRSLSEPVASRQTLHEVSRVLVRSLYPPSQGVRLVGVSLSNLETTGAAANQLALS